GGLSSSVTAAVTVGHANVAPNAVLTVTPQSGVAPLSVTADSSRSSDSDGSIVSRKIDFGDGSTATTVSTTHVYQQAGNYTVRLTVTDNGGLSSSATATVTVGHANVAPSAVLSVTPQSGTAPLSVTADSSSSSDSDGSIVSRKIDFG